MVEYAIALALGLLVLFGLLLRLRRRPGGPRYAVVDGSNVMFWINEEARFDTLKSVLDHLLDAGFLPVVWFDANAGYKLAGRYMKPEALARALDLPRSRVKVAPRGTPADPLLLAQARKLGAPVVSNDRFRDWEEEFPELRDAAHMIRGRVRNGAIHLDVREGLTAR